MRERFPLLVEQAELAYLDSAATAQRVGTALQAEAKYYRELNSNVHRGIYPMSERATEMYEAVREKVRDFLSARETAEIIFTRGTTEALNIVAQSWGRQNLKEGDEIVLTLLEHHSNIVPWQMVAERTGAVVKFCPITDDGRLDMDAMGELITDRTKIVSVTGLSNVLGTVVSIEEVVEMARKVDAKVCVDAAQLAAHFPIDVLKLDIDFLAFSSHKIYGPTGAGVLYAKREILETMEPWLGGGDMIKTVTTEGSTWNDLPWKFEAGTPPIAQVIGMGGAIDFLNEIGFTWIKEHDRELQEYAVEQLSKLPYVTVLGPKDSEYHRAAISFLMKEVHPHDVAAILGEAGVCVRAGHHCAMPLMQELGVPGTSRASFGVYTTKEDVDRLVDGLEKVAQTFVL